MTSSDRDSPATGVRVWTVPPVDGAQRQAHPEPSPEPVPAPPTPEEIEHIQKQAYDEAFAIGMEEGRRAGLEAVRPMVERLEAIVRRLARPLEALDQRIEDELTHLVMAVAGQLIRRELRTDPGQIVAAVREAVGVLADTESTVSLHLHPEDARLLRETLTGDEGQGLWRIVEDPALTRGGCRVVNEVSQVDATLERRLAAVAAQVLGGERAEDAHD